MEILEEDGHPLAVGTWVLDRDFRMLQFGASCFVRRDLSFAAFDKAVKGRQPRFKAVQKVANPPQLRL